MSFTMNGSYAALLGIWVLSLFVLVRNPVSNNSCCPSKKMSLVSISYYTLGRSAV